jgi:hypothetical protein
MKLLSEYYGDDEYANREANVYLEERWSSISQEFRQEYVVEFITKKEKTNNTTKEWHTTRPNSKIYAEDAAENWVMGIDNSSLS